MALKDWKKEQFRYEWWNKKLGETIDIATTSWQQSQAKYIVRFFNTFTGYDKGKWIRKRNKNFPTKSQALKFARAYMRKH